MKHDGRRIGKWTGAALLLFVVALAACTRLPWPPGRLLTGAAAKTAVIPVATPTLASPSPASAPAASPTVSLPAAATSVRVAPASTPITSAPPATPTVPRAAAQSPTAPAAAITWVTYSDEEKSFKYPAGWKGEIIMPGIQYRLEGDGEVTKASIYARQAYRLGTSYYPTTGVERKSTTAVDYLSQFLDSWLTSQTYTMYDQRQTETINGNPAIIQPYTQVHGGRDVQGSGNTKGIAAVVQTGNYAYFINMYTREQWQATYEPVLWESLRSFTAKKG